MNDLIKTSTVNMSKEDWLKHRQDGIGGSEAAIVMGLNPFQSSIELFYRKMGEFPEQETNAAMFFGNYLEDSVANLFQYWQTDTETMIKNYEAGTKIYKLQKVNSILKNPKYPHLLANIDRLILSPRKEVLEIKTVSGFTLNQWTAGVPPYMLIQLQTYLLITGLQYGQLCLMKDGRFMEVYQFEANRDIQDGIVDKTEKFWQRVISARILKEAGKPFESLEPDPDSSEAYAEFLKKKFRSKPVTLEGTHDQYQTALKYMDCNARLKTINEEKTGHANLLKSALREAEKIDFGKGGYCSWAESEDGKRIFNVKAKVV